MRKLSFPHGTSHRFILQCNLCGKHFKTKVNCRKHLIFHNFPFITIGNFHLDNKKCVYCLFHMDNSHWLIYWDCNVICVDSISKQILTLWSIWKRHPMILRLQHVCQVCCNNNTKCLNRLFHTDNHIDWDYNVICVESISRQK